MELLTTQFDTKKSFYNKATIEKETKGKIDYITLYSYNTKVLTITYNYNKNYKCYELENDFLLSNTTLRHIKEILKQNYFQDNINIETKKDILKNNKEKVYF